MNTEQQAIASRIRPVAEPRILDEVYSEDQYQRMLGVVRDRGPWQLILAQHFASAQEVVATLSGALPEGVEPSFDHFLTSNFRGYFARHGTCLYPELEDCFFNSKFLGLVRDYWQAEYARPDNMLFNINGPCDSHDPAHLDATQFRGINQKNTPIWLMNTMTKSGLFDHWLMKRAQVITWFYPGRIGGGFTYWPQGPLEAPKRVSAPMRNRGVVVQNEMMYHRGEACGPQAERKPAGLAFESLLGADPQSPDGWQITTGDQVVQRIPAEELRFLVHWSAEIYQDKKELAMVMEQTDDLSHEQVFDMLIADLRRQGHQFDPPSDPLRDTAFISLLTRVYDVGAPRVYPPEAPGPGQELAA